MRWRKLIAGSAGGVRFGTARLLGFEGLAENSYGAIAAIADRKASVLRVNGVHEDVKFTRTITKAVQSELEDLAAWLELGAVESV